MKNGKKKIIGFTCGAFDLLHAGHYLMFKEAKSKCNYLIVGLQIDPSTTSASYRGKKKHKPIETIKERKIKLQGCKYIDKIVLYHTETDLYNLLKKLKPDVRFLGADWKGKNYTGKDLPIKIIFNSRNHHYSSTNLIKRIIKEHKKYES